MTPMSSAEGLELVKLLLFWIPLVLGIAIALKVHHRAMAATFCLLLWVMPWGIIFFTAADAVVQRQWFVASFEVPLAVAFTVFVFAGIKGINDGTFWVPFSVALTLLQRKIQGRQAQRKIRHERIAVVTSANPNWLKEKTGPEYPARHF